MSNDLFLSIQCPMTRTMATISTKWKPIIIYAVGKKKVRFGQLAAHISLISRKVLTEQLKELEEDGILIRESFKEIPPRVEYSLTEKGLGLLPILKSMCDWNRKYEGTRACKRSEAGA